MEEQPKPEPKGAEQRRAEAIVRSRFTTEDLGYVSLKAIIDCMEEYRSQGIPTDEEIIKRLANISHKLC